MFNLIRPYSKNPVSWWPKPRKWRKRRITSFAKWLLRAPSCSTRSVSWLVGQSASRPDQEQKKKNKIKKKDLLFEDPSEPSQGTCGLLHLLPWWQDPAFAAFRNSQNTELTVSFCCSRPPRGRKLLCRPPKTVEWVMLNVSFGKVSVPFSRYYPAFNLLFIDSNILNPLFNCTSVPLSIVFKDLLFGVFFLMPDWRKALRITHWLADLQLLSVIRGGARP